MRDPNVRRRLIATIAQFLIVSCLFWAALHEEERLQYAQIGVHAQSIERGAELYLIHCAVCHGLDGLGLVGHAPALNNPQLFGHNFFPEVTGQIGELNREITALTREKTADGTSDTRKTEIDEQIIEIEVAIDDLNAQREHTIHLAVNKGYDPEYYDRLWELSWNGTLESLLLTTLIHGRPNSASYWSSPMPAYSEEAFADFILERYQLEDLTAYMMNWDKGDNWALDDLYAVEQFPIQAEDPKPYRELFEKFIDNVDTVPILPPPVGTDTESILKEITKPMGDAARGDQLYHGQVVSGFGSILACIGCHQDSVDGIGPMTEGTYTRVINERLKQSQFIGYTAEKYLIESIVLPGNHIVDGYVNAMQMNFGEILTTQDLADLIAYLQTQNQ